MDKVEIQTKNGDDGLLIGGPIGWKNGRGTGKLIIEAGIAPSKGELHINTDGGDDEVFATK